MKEFHVLLAEAIWVKLVLRWSSSKTFKYVSARVLVRNLLKSRAVHLMSVDFEVIYLRFPFEMLLPNFLTMFGFTLWMFLLYSREEIGKFINMVKASFKKNSHHSFYF